MPLVIVGALLLVAKMAEFGPFAHWSWWIVLSPFAAAVLWWEFADSTGWTQRRAMDKMEQRKTDRRERAMDALGLNKRREKQVTRARRDAARRTSDDAPAAGSPPAEPKRDPKL